MSSIEVVINIWAFDFKMMKLNLIHEIGLVYDHVR